jgi:hypothetical protein
MKERKPRSGKICERVRSIASEDDCERVIQEIRADISGNLIDRELGNLYVGGLKDLLAATGPRKAYLAQSRLRHLMEWEERNCREQ